MTASVFKDTRHPIFHERVVLGRHPGRLAWKLRQRGQRDVVIDGGTGAAGEQLVVLRLGSPPGDPFSYLRGHFVVAAEECGDALEFRLALQLRQAAGLHVTLSLFEDAAQERRTASVECQPLVGEGRETAVLRVPLPPPGAVPRPVYGFLQIGFTAAAGAEIGLESVSATSLRTCPGWRPLRIRYDAFGDVGKASSRLRVWRFAELLRAEGHAVAVDGRDFDVDLHICQKVRPFDAVRAVRERNPHAVVVYDVDDNYLLPEEGKLADLLAFIAQVDVVTCGSEFLAEGMRQWHGNVHVLENPLDADEASAIRPARGTLARIGWFGAPEGLGELARVQLAQPVETVTRGGTVEFDLQTIDRDLAGFDLLLFPVEPTPWNLAKNANRMMKALGLGVPVLASDTPEQRRLALRAGLPEAALCAPGTDWNAAVDALRRDWSAYEAQIPAAAAWVRGEYSARAVLGRLFGHLFATTALGGAARPPLAASAAQERVAALLVDGSGDGAAVSLDRSAVDWRRFQAVHVLSVAGPDNASLTRAGPRLGWQRCDYPDVFSQADAVVAGCEVGHLLVVPPGVALAHALPGTVDTLLAAGVEAVAVLPRAGWFSGALVGVLGAQPARELLVEPHLPGPLLVNVDWLRASGLRWSQCYGLWSWRVLLHALATGAPVQALELPVAFEAMPVHLPQAPAEYAAWLREHAPGAARELPSVSRQWARMVADITADGARGAPADLPSAFGELHAQHLLVSARLRALQREMRALKQGQGSTDVELGE